jgi:hypothetical protein
MIGYFIRPGYSLFLLLYFHIIFYNLGTLCFFFLLLDWDKTFRDVSPVAFSNGVTINNSLGQLLRCKLQHHIKLALPPPTKT